MVGSTVRPKQLAAVFIVRDSVAALKQTKAPNSRSVFCVLGYFAPGDGGGGFYRWNKTDSTADNGGTIVELTSGGRGRFNKLF